MKSALRVSSREPVTVPQWLEPIRAFFWFRASLMPTDHSDSYKRQWLTGARSLPFNEYLGCLDRMFRRSGRDACAAAVNAWLVRFGLRALPLHTDRPQVKDAKSEMLEAFESTSSAINYLSNALRDGKWTAAEKHEFRQRIARAHADLDDLDQLIS